MNSARLLRIFIGFLLICAIVFAVRALTTEAEPENKTPPPAPVRLAKAELSRVPYFLSGIGTVISPHSAVMKAQVDGQLIAVAFTEGQAVKKGDLLAEIDPRPFQAALNQAKAARAQVEAQLALARLELERSRKLLAEDAVAQAVIDQQLATVRQLEASLAASEAAVATAEVQLGFTRIVSPVNGRAGIRQIDPGNLVSANDTGGIVTVTQIDPVTVIFSLPQTALSQLRTVSHAGNGATSDKQAGVDALDRDGGKVLAKGKLSTIDNAVDTATGTIRLRAVFDNGDAALWPGQLVTARLTSAVQDDALVIPVRAIQKGRDGSYVYRAAGDTVKTVPVEITFQNEYIAVIGKGLQPGDAVVTDGQLRLKDGAKITQGEQTAKPDANAAADKPG